MSQTTRTFLALPLPEDRAEKLAKLQKLIAPELPGARWIEPEKFHVTLAFLGDVPDLELPRLCLAVAEACRPLAPFELALESLGVFPDPLRPRVVWTGLAGHEDRLVELQQAVVEAARRAGYPPEDDRFHPHVTLGRLKPRREASGDCSPLLRHYERWRGGAFPVAEVITYASGFDREGPVYMPLGKAPLRGKSRS